METKPPTTNPEAGQGPWFSDVSGKWWVVADRPQDAIAAIDSADPDAFPRYFGWKAIIEPVLIAWAENFDDEEYGIEEQPYETEATTEAWRVSFEGR